MGQLVSDVTEVLNYNKSKKEVENQRQQILQEIANDEKAKTNLVKKALNLIIAAFIIIAVQLVLTVTAGFIDVNNTGAIQGIMLAVSFMGLAAAILTIVGYGFGGKGGVQRYRLAFWFEIGVIIIAILNIIFAFIPNISNVVFQVFSLISILFDLAATFLAVTACKEAVPETSKLAIAAVIVLAVGYLLTLIGIFVPAVVIFAGLVLLAGEIVYIVLVCKTRAKIA